MLSVSSRIWTRVAVSISYDDNHYTTGTMARKMRFCPRSSHTNGSKNTSLFTLRIMYQEQIQGKEYPSPLHVAKCLKRNSDILLTRPDKGTGVVIFLVANFTLMNLYIYCHPQTNCFVVSQLSSVSRHAGRFKQGLKPAQLYARQIADIPNIICWAREITLTALL